MQSCVIWSPDCIAGFACPGPVTNSPWRAAPRCGALFSGPAHAEFRFCSPKVPPPKSPSGLAPIQELEGGKPRGGLRDLPHSEQKGFQPFVPIFGVFVNELSNHCFQRTIKSFHQAVRLWVIDAGANQLNSQQFIKFANGSWHKRRALIGENLFRDCHPGDHTEQSLRYTLCGNVAERHCLRVSGCIILGFLPFRVSGTTVTKFGRRKEADKVGSWKLGWFYCFLDKLKQVRTLRVLCTSTLSVVSAITLCVRSGCLFRHRPCARVSTPSLNELPFHGGFYPVSTPITAIRHRCSSFCTWPTYLPLSPESFSRCRHRWTTPPSPHIYYKYIQYYILGSFYNFNSIQYKQKLSHESGI